MSKNTLKWVVFAGLFVVPFIPFLVSSSFFFPFITTKAFVWRIIVEVVFALWLFLALADEQYRPRKSPILYVVFGFIAVVGLADLFGAAPIKSFWSNFERMEGFVSLLHLGAFFLIISSVFREDDWKRWWNTSLFASALMVCYGLFQVLGVIAPSQSDARVDGTFGNAIYLAVYLLFHIFIALFFLWRSRGNQTLRWLYGILIFFQILILYYTATRGAILGLLGGLFILALLNLRNREDRIIRKLSIAVVTLLVVLTGGFFMIRQSAFVQESAVLSRFATLNLTDLKTQGRYFVWPMALKGIVERPLLGWGQENFSYIFQKYYTPEMYRLEAWFDRAHNVFLDWAVAGGLAGLVFYLALYLIPFYLIWRDKAGFSPVEKSILVALLAAYFFHNFFVFDHLVSYILFFSLLSYIHYRTAGEVFWVRSFSETQAKKLVRSAVLVLLILTFYFVNWKPLIGNLALIESLKALQSGQPALAAENFVKAHNASRLGRLETIEQIAMNATKILSSNLSIEERNIFYAFAKEAITDPSPEMEESARQELVAGSFLSMTGYFDEALVHLIRAKELSPNKQQIFLEIAQAYYAKGDKTEAIETLKILQKLSPDHSAEIEGYIKQINNQ